MRLMRTGMADDLFARAHGATWVGGIHALSRNLEAVPVVFDGQRYLMEFETPAFLTQVDAFENIVYATNRGGSFVPKLNHRVIRISLADGGQNLRSLCRLSATEGPSNHERFSAAIRRAVLTYYRSTPHANQYFFLTTPETRAMLLAIFHPLPPEIADHYDLHLHDELADPFIGFTLVSKLL